MRNKSKSTLMRVKNEELVVLIREEYKRTNIKEEDRSLSLERSFKRQLVEEFMFVREQETFVEEVVEVVQDQIEEVKIVDKVEEVDIDNFFEQLEKNNKEVEEVLKSTKSVTQQILELFEEGVAIKIIAKELGKRYQQVYNTLKRKNLI